MVVKKGSLDEILRRLDALGVENETQDFHIFGPGHTLSEGQPFADLAAAVARDLCGLLDGVVR